MAAWGKWTAIIGGLLAIIGAFWATASWLTWVGGIIAVIGGFGSD